MKTIQNVMAIVEEEANKKEAFEKLFFRHKDKVYTIAFTYTESQLDAEEIVQDTFLRVWKNQDKLSEIENIEAWLYTIARNLSLTALKKIATEGKRKESFITYLPTETHNSNSADAALQDREMQSLLQKALTRLSPQQRKVFEMSRLQGIDRAAIAERMGLSPATVSVHLTIALRMVRAFLLSQTDMSITVLVLSFSLLFKIF